MSGADTTTAEKILKKMYLKGDFEVLVAKISPFLGELKKPEDFEGESKDIPIQIAHGQGVANTFSVAQANVGANVYKKFVMTTKDIYGVAKFSRKLMKLTRSNVGSFVRSAKAEVDSVLEQVQLEMGFQVWNNGGGSRGRIKTGSTLASPTISLETPSDIVNFYEGMKIVISDVDGTSGALRSGGAATVVALNPSLTDATITLGSNWSTIWTAVAVRDHIFREGCWGNCISGVPAWVPASDPSATLYYGVDRTTNPVKLGGIRKSASGATMEAALIDACVEGHIHGALFDRCYLHPIEVGTLTKELRSAGRLETVHVNSTVANIGYSGIKLRTPVGKGELTVLSDMFAPKGVGHLFELDTWTLESAGQCPEFFVDDVGKILRVYNEDAYEARMGGYWNLSCKAPGKNMRLTF